MLLVDSSASVRARFRGCRDCGFDDGVLDVPATHDVPFGEFLEIDVRCKWSFLGMNLQLPNSGAFLHARHFEKNMRPNSTLKCGIEVRGQIGRKDHNAVEGLQLSE